MGLERYVVDAVVLEQRSPREIARLYGISKSWVYELLARVREGGYEALSPRSRRPRSGSHQVDPALRAAIVQLRRELEEAGGARPRLARHSKSRLRRSHAASVAQTPA
ncbi:MAG TPA: helix-turn-helix domain-containing protein [Candidatus Dormibacteraeota bacterium]|nr:helix-turn-helix domain-containing protein [Candidatus Dormibacteraeota bacterium]